MSAPAKPGRLIERAWLTYRAAVIPADARANQVIESRRAFYSGAWALMNLQMSGFTVEREPTDADLQMMESIDAELRAFNDCVQAGTA